MMGWLWPAVPSRLALAGQAHIGSAPEASSGLQPTLNVTVCCSPCSEVIS